MKIIQSVRWTDDGLGVRIIDQRLLPARLVERELRSLDDVTDAIRTLAVRGAPAIGIAGAMGLVAVLAPNAKQRRDTLLADARNAADAIRATRPTAVNLSWALERVLARASQADGDSEEQRQKDGEQEDQNAANAAQQQQNGQDSPNKAPGPEDVEKWASEQAAEQWLRRVPQDPGGLLRRKFLYQYQRMGVDQDGKPVLQNGPERKPW